MSWVDADRAPPSIPRLRRLGCMSHRLWKQTRHQISIIHQEN
ncbi:MAG: hypothetical protein ACLFWL_13170 [Candidatus Brocadiia bacterium]